MLRLPAWHRLAGAAYWHDRLETQTFWRRGLLSLLAALKERFATLSSREREVMIRVTAGRLNKQIANDIGIAESTVKVHRTHLMRKMKARSLPELSRMADLLNLATEKPLRS